MEKDVGQKRWNDMTNLKFHNYLNEQLKDPVFRTEFEAENAKLEKVITLSQAQEQSVSQSTIAHIAHDNTTNN